MDGIQNEARGSPEQIKADGIVRRIEAGRGLALKFTAVSDQDRPRLAKLMIRLRQSS